MMWPCFPGLDLANKMPSPRTMKSHLPVNMIPPSFWKKNSKVRRANSSTPVLINVAEEYLYLSGNSQRYWKTNNQWRYKADSGIPTHFLLNPPMSGSKESTSQGDLITNSKMAGNGG